MKVRFTKHPTGAFNLGYSIGQEADISDADLVKRLLEQGYAVAATSTPDKGPEKETATAKTPAKETRKK